MTTTDPAPPGAVDARWLAARISGLRPVDIRRDVAGLIADGVLRPGWQLPTVREVAAQLGISVGTVSSAWAELSRDGLLVTRRRGGTSVAADPGALASALPADLVTAPADPKLLPELSRAFEAATGRGRHGGVASLAPELRRAAELRWAYPPPALLALSGVRAALHLVTSALLPAGAAIATVDPLCLRTADSLRRLGAPIVPVAEDAQGPLPQSLAAAVDRGAQLFCFEPALSVPTGVSLTADRAAELAEVLRAAPESVRVFEEDTAGALAETRSLGELVPERVLRAVPYARAFGADLGVTLLSGPAADIAALARLQAEEGALLGVLVQRVLARLLVDRAAATRTRAAAAAYARRNTALRQALAERGVDAAGDGFFLWVPVADETEATVSLAAHGIRASPGARSRLAAPGDPRLRVATTRVPDDARGLAELAGLIAAAADRRPEVHED